MNGTMSDITGMMGKRGVQISRSTYVMLQHIVAYNNDTITVKGRGKENVILKISSAYKKNVSQRITHFSKTEEKSTMIQDHITISEHSGEVLNKKLGLIFAFISENPCCSSEDIMAKTNLSRSSVAKYIARLKQQGLIRHVGSNKTGGYEAVEGEMR